MQEQDLSRLRLYLMRVVFLLTFIGLAPSTWTEMLTYEGTWDPLQGVAMSFWAALAALALIGILYPVKMMPLLFLQMTYKLIWLLGVGLPLWCAGEFDAYTQELAMANGVGVLVDIAVIPWIYVYKQYFVKVRL